MGPAWASLGWGFFKNNCAWRREIFENLWFWGLLLGEMFSWMQRSNASRAVSP
jgi:hypothetical protein